MAKQNHPSASQTNGNGFTLPEVIIVLIIMSVLGFLVVHKVLTLDSATTQKSFEYAVSELNSRESLTWSRIRTATGSGVNDDQVFAELDTNLGSEYRWSYKTPDGGTLRFKEHEVQLGRTHASSSQPGSWKIR